jgi:NitT/TauT family transport system permease protein
MSSKRPLKESATTSSVRIRRERRPRRLARIWRGAREIVLPTAVLIVLGLIWEVVVRGFEIPVFMLPAPSSIWTESVGIPGELLVHTAATIWTVMVGFLVSVAVSLPLAVIITSSQNVSNAIYPLLVLMNSIPKVALAPILVVLLGTGELPGIVVTFLVAFFPLVISIATGLLSTPTDLLDLGRFYQASRLEELYRIRLPYSVPFIFSGLKVASSLAVVGAVVGEFVAADRGLGYLIVSSMAFFNTSVAFGAMGILSIMGIVLFQIVVIVERVFFPWAMSENDVGE